MEEINENIEEQQEIIPAVIVEIPKIYKYSATTGEYLCECFADSDPEETKIKGYFVPLVPANATLNKPEEYGENEIPVFENGEWGIKKDFRKCFEVDENLDIKPITHIGDVEGIVITKEFAEEISENPDYYKIEDNEVVKKSDEEISADYLYKAKKAKNIENDAARDKALYAGVEYKGVLFDSDTDQKINLLAIISTMSDEDVITWFGMDNQPLECTKADLMAIGGLITELHSFCWAANAGIKKLINEADTVEAVENIYIDYNNDLNDEIPF